MNKYIITIISFACLLSSFSANAGCMDGITSANKVVTKIRGFYANPDTSSQYVIIDKSNCALGFVPDRAIGTNTKNNYYMYFNASDKFLSSALLTAYAKGETVELILGPINESGYNIIGYAVTPAGARNQ